MLSWLGIVMAGVLNGTFAVPMKTARTWKFNHVWSVFSLLAMVVIPWLAVFFATPGWRVNLSVIVHAGLGGLVTLGLFWGVASLLYGLAIDLLGIALGFSIQLGLSIVAGALIPFAAIRGLAVRNGHDVAFLLGRAAMVIGVTVCGCAGRGTKRKESNKKFRLGIMIAILGGIGSPLMNFGIQYGIALLPHGIRHASAAQWLPWAICLSAAALPQIAICFYRIARAGEMSLYLSSSAAHNTSWILVMSFVWTASIFVYGASAASLGRFGTSIGWPVFIAMIIVTSNAWGLALGEWEGRGWRQLLMMLSGSAVLIAATFLISRAKTDW